MGSLLPKEEGKLSYAQLYIHDPAEALSMRNRRNPNLNPEIISQLQDLLQDVNPYVALYRHAYLIMKNKPHEEYPNIEVRLHVGDGTDGRWYNLPTVNELAAIIPGDGSEPVQNDRDIVLRMHDHSLKRISQFHPSYQSLHYVLLFPHGELGWNIHMLLEETETSERREQKKITQHMYYAYRLHDRPGIEPNAPLYRGGPLYQQYIVDAWASIEQSNLNWVRNNQKTIRADLYKGVVDAATNADGLQDSGQRIVLPSSHTGSPRAMYQLYQDSMAICRALQKPDIFLTMTANPQWPEIVEALKRTDGPDQKVEDRPDIVAKVFQLKKEALLDEIKKGGIFGKVRAMVHTIEFQKRGLPHMHLLIFLDPEDKICTPADADSVSCAQIPDPVTQPVLYEIVTRCMVHGPCDHRCKGPDGRCTKNFPKEFNEHTEFTNDGYPNLARPDNGREYVKIRGQTHTIYTNRDIVPYNPYLSAKYNCDINVEVCVSVKAIKYIHKYIYKGHDRTTLEVQDHDEIKEFLDARYISAIESCWRIFSFRLHQEEPNVVRLQVHLPDEQLITYDENDSPEEVLAAAEAKTTTLLQWFDLNKRDPSAHQYLYQDIPAHYTWNKSKKRWNPRQRYTTIGVTIGRMYQAAPSSGEQFYLQLLLTAVSGAQSFQHLRTINNVECATFKEACIAMGLLENDNEWRQCLQEAAIMQSGAQLRSLFVTLLLFCQPAKPDELWEEFKENICDDLAHKLRQRDVPNPTDAQLYDFGLHLINKLLQSHGRRLSEWTQMPASIMDWAAYEDNPLLAAQLAYDIPSLQQLVANNLQTFNEEQKTAYNIVFDSAMNERGKLVFVHSAGGGGKTFVCNTIAAAVRAEGKIALTCASSGISAILLVGGRTSHSTFKIPIPSCDDTTCSIWRGTHLAELLCRTSLIIWDEVPMQNRHDIETVDRTLCDICNKDAPFGGKTVLFGGMCVYSELL